MSVENLKEYFKIIHFWSETAAKGLKCLYCGKEVPTAETRCDKCKGILKEIEGNSFGEFGSELRQQVRKLSYKEFERFYLMQKIS